MSTCCLPSNYRRQTTAAASGSCSLSPPLSSTAAASCTMCSLFPPTSSTSKFHHQEFHHPLSHCRPRRITCACGCGSKCPRLHFRRRKLTKFEGFSPPVWWLSKVGCVCASFLSTVLTKRWVVWVTTETFWLASTRPFSNFLIKIRSTRNTCWIEITATSPSYFPKLIYFSRCISIGSAWRNQWATREASIKSSIQK